MTPDEVRRRFAKAIAGERASDPKTIAAIRGDHSLVPGGAPPASALTPASDGRNLRANASGSSPATSGSVLPESVFWGCVPPSGKLVEVVEPVRYTLPDPSIAISLGMSSPVPPM